MSLFRFYCVLDMCLALVITGHAIIYIDDCTKSIYNIINTIFAAIIIAIFWPIILIHLLAEK